MDTLFTPPGVPGELREIVMLAGSKTSVTRGVVQESWVVVLPLKVPSTLAATGPVASSNKTDRTENKNPGAEFVKDPPLLKVPLKSFISPHWFLHN